MGANTKRALCIVQTFNFEEKKFQKKGKRFLSVLSAYFVLGYINVRQSSFKRL